MEKLRYTDETDRCYGAAGMAISLVVFDGEEILSAISLDGPEGAQTMSLTPDFFFAGNPGVSAKTAWRQILKNYNLGIAMMTANLLCRYLVNRHTGLPSDVVDELRALALDEGRDSCQLEEDEIDSIFDKNINYLTRVFTHRGVHSVAHDFASALKSRRTLSRLDALEILQALQSI
ncbi:MAG: hypothetical protein NC039_03430 [Muribaculaceae bacterium]|nr:hypothetical protein [Muribaculaceae bacterium]